MLKVLRIVSLPHSEYDFSRKIFLMLYSVNLPNFIDWLPLLLEILVKMCIEDVCQPGCDVTDFSNQTVFLHDQRVKTEI